MVVPLVVCAGSALAGWSGCTAYGYCTERRPRVRGKPVGRSVQGGMPHGRADAPIGEGNAPEIWCFCFASVWQQSRMLGGKNRGWPTFFFFLQNVVWGKGASRGSRARGACKGPMYVLASLESLGNCVPLGVVSFAPGQQEIGHHMRSTGY